MISTPSFQAGCKYCCDIPEAGKYKKILLSNAENK